MLACPYCRHSKTGVIDTRATKENHIRRRRKCALCAMRFSTVELTHAEVINMYREASIKPPAEIVESVREVPVFTVREVVSSEAIRLLDLAERALDPNEDYEDVEDIRKKIDTFLKKRGK